MKCLRCGYCCISYNVVILIDPDKGMEEGNVRLKPTGERCMHLRGDTSGQYSCAIHDHPIYKETPCFDFGQIEYSPDDPCRIGEGVLAKKVPEFIPIQRIDAS